MHVKSPRMRTEAECEDRRSTHFCPSNTVVACESKTLRHRFSSVSGTLMTFFTLCNARTAFVGAVADTISSESQWTRGNMRGRPRGNMLAGTDYVQAVGAMGGNGSTGANAGQASVWGRSRMAGYNRAGPGKR